MNYEYTLITPARNEEQFIEITIQSVVNQTILPIKWVIVNDGSTDKTNEIINRYCNKYPWIDVVELPVRNTRQFAAKVFSFNAGYEKLKNLNYDIIGNLDADISFEGDYFEYLLDKFSKIPDLGVAGTPFIENNYSSIDDSFEGEKHVAGGCQLFRKTCFQEIGGYVPIKGGGVDWVAVTTARMKGWKTTSFKDKTFFHHRRLGTAESNRFKSIFQYGQKDYYLGGHPLWEFFRILFSMTKKPYFMVGLVLMSGYLWSFILHVKRPISKELVSFHRKEQIDKLKKIILKNLFYKKYSE